MSLLVLFRPRATTVTPPPPSTDVPIIPGHGVKRVQRPLDIRRVPAGLARVNFRALSPRLLLVSSAARASATVRAFSPEYELTLSSEARRQPLKYRAARDERDIDELVETAYLLSR